MSISTECCTCNLSLLSLNIPRSCNNQVKSLNHPANLIQPINRCREHPKCFCALFSKTAAGQVLGGWTYPNPNEVTGTQGCPVHLETHGISIKREGIMEVGCRQPDLLSSETHQKPVLLLTAVVKSQRGLQLSLHKPHEIFHHPALPEQLVSDNRLGIVWDVKTFRKF